MNQTTIVSKQTTVMRDYTPLSIDTHNTHPELYAALAKVFGEHTADKEDPAATRWVTVGAGQYELVFFRDSSSDTPVAVDA